MAVNVGEMFVRLSATATDVKKGTDEGTRHLESFGAAAKRMSVTVGTSSAATTSALNTVRGAMTSMAGAALSAAPGVAPLASVLGSMAIGTPMMIGVLAGAAAIATAWNRITAAAREAKEEQQDALGRLQALQRQQALGAGGQTAEDIKTQRIRLGELAIQAQRLQRELNALPAAVIGVGGGAMAAARAGVAARLAAVQEEQRTIQGAMQAGSIAVDKLLQDAEAKRLADQEAAARARQTAADQARARELAAMRDYTQRLADMARRQAAILSPLDPTRDPFGPVASRSGMVALGGVASPGGSGAAAAAGPASAASRALAALSQSAGSLLAPFSALTPISIILSAAFETMGPAIEVLLMPLRAFGKLLGTVVGGALSYFAEGLGWVIRAIGKLINLLPGSPGNGLVRFGQDMIDAAKAARNAADGVGALDAAARNAANSVTNMPAIFDLAVRRRQAGAGSIPGTTSGGGVSGGGGDTGITVHIHNPPASLDTNRVVRDVTRGIVEASRRGGTPELALALRSFNQVAA